MIEILHIPIDDVAPFEGQPRTEFDEAKLCELAESIAEVGQLVSALVRQVSPGKFELVDGERRWRACRMAGVATLKCELISATDAADQFRKSTAANFGRADHTPLEIARAIARLHADGMTLAGIARLIGKSIGFVNLYRKLLNLTPAVQKMVSETDPKKRLRFVHATQIADLPAGEQLKIAKQCIAKSMGAYEVGRIVRKKRDELGIPVDSARGRRPSDDWRVISNLPLTLLRIVDPMLSLTEDDLTAFFTPRKAAEIQGFMHRLEEVSGDLVMFTELVGQVGRKLCARKERACKA